MSRPAGSKNEKGCLVDITIDTSNQNIILFCFFQAQQPHPHNFPIEEFMRLSYCNFDVKMFDVNTDIFKYLDEVNMIYFMNNIIIWTHLFSCCFRNQLSA